MIVYFVGSMAFNIMLLIYIYILRETIAYKNEQIILYKANIYEWERRHGITKKILTETEEKI